MNYSPNILFKNDSKSVNSSVGINLQNGILLDCEQKSIHPNVNSFKELKKPQLLKESPLLSSVSTPCYRNKSPAVNACYTPSSLFRNANINSTPSCKKLMQKSKQYLTNCIKKMNDAEDRLRVAVRIRPLNAKECVIPTISNIIRVQKNEVTVLVGSSADASSGVSHSFTYDYVFESCDPESSYYAHQKDVFLNTAQPLIGRAFEGYNGCLFAYGQTGSGKSYSMMGLDTFDVLDNSGNTSSRSKIHYDAGIIPRFCYELFQFINNAKGKFNVEVEVSYFEIYNEKIHDLLCVSQHIENSVNGKVLGHTPTKARKALKVREHPLWGPYVVDLSIHPVDSYEALRNWLIVGNSQRATAATGLNDKSSRSHSIFNIMLKINHYEFASTNFNEKLHVRRSKICLVDLAGSERINGSNGERIREGVLINKSLLTLGKVISALSELKNFNSSVFVPYRESVLTWLLKENLGGNSKTVMLATISPASINVDETLATLRYACQARRIVNRVKVNESEHDKVIRELKSEVERLKSLHYEYERQKRFSGNANATPRKIIIDKSNVNEAEIENLREQLLEREKELRHAQKSWMERLKEADYLRKSGLNLLKRRGLAIEINKEEKHAYLINLTEDPMLTETLFYMIPSGCVKIGRTRSILSGTNPDIILDGPLVGHNHCVIENISGELFVTPENENFETYLNGELVKNKKKLFHGDRLVIGGSHFYRVSNPFCPHSKIKKTLADFYQAYQEVLETQEHKLRLELEEEKRIALSRIETDRIEHERKVKERMDKIELEQLMLKCNKEILESERKVIAGNKQNLNFMESIACAINSPHTNESTIYDEINNIMHQPSEESLHKIQLMIEWSKDAVLVLIQAREDNECLYNPKSELYHNNHARSNALEKVVEELETHIPNISPNEVKIKMNYLRTQYCRILSKIKDSYKSGCGYQKIYSPTTYWFDKLNFLKGYVNIMRGISSVPVVKEATQHCRNHRLLYEFQQSKIIDEFGFCHTKILIIDRKRGLKAAWPIARLGVWLESIREQENLNSMDIFNCFDIEWNKLDISLNEITSGSIHSSRISLNISAFKETIIKSDISTTHQIKDFDQTLQILINETHCSISKLKTFCKVHNNDSQFKCTKKSKVITESIEKLEYILGVIRTCVDEKHCQND